MTEILEQALPILGLIRDEAVRKKVEALLKFCLDEPREYGTPLDALLNNFAFAVPTSWHWHDMLENPEKRCRYQVNGNDIANREHTQTVLEIIQEHGMNPKWFEYNRYRARHWDEVRWHDFKIFCILIDRGYSMSKLQG
ncbi:MAG TPA: hypothetical protein VGC58_01250 [Candidatus Paceibacterota bacterium]